jgi:glycosyltransferase involved in cell wall biosynthesis
MLGVEMRAQRKITHLTDGHSAVDERIFHKAAKFSCNAGYKVSICGIHPVSETLDGVEIIPIRSFRSMWRKFLYSLFGFTKLAIQLDADIYHFHDPGLIPLGLILRCFGKRVIYDVHEDYQQKLLSRLSYTKIINLIITKIWWLFESLTSRWFNHIIVADSNTSKKFPPLKTSVVPNVPSKEFWEGFYRQRNDDEIRVIYVGSITNDRGIKETIMGLNHLKYKNVSFHVYGSTDDNELRQTLNSHPRVHWHGFVKWTELGRELVNADIATALFQPVPAYYYYTGENVVKLWEYLSIGLPVIISNFPLLKKLCAELGVGIDVDPTNPKEIAKAIDYLIEHPDKRRYFGENGIRAVRDEYNAEKKMQILIGIYDTLLSESQKRSIYSES